MFLSLETTLVQLVIDRFERLLDVVVLNEPEKIEQRFDPLQFEWMICIIKKICYNYARKIYDR